MWVELKAQKNVLAGKVHKINPKITFNAVFISFLRRLRHIAFILVMNGYQHGNRFVSFVAQQ